MIYCISFIFCQTPSQCTSIVVCLFHRTNSRNRNHLDTFLCYEPVECHLCYGFSMDIRYIFHYLHQGFHSFNVRLSGFGKDPSHKWKLIVSFFCKIEMAKIGCYGILDRNLFPSTIFSCQRPLSQ